MSFSTASLGEKMKTMKQFIILITIITLTSCSKENHLDLPSGSHEMRFDPNSWKLESSYIETDEKFITKRQKMLGDLVTNVLPGKTESEIESLLGQSLDSPYGGNSRDMIYYTGPIRDSYVPIDSEWLLIWIDESKKFEKYALHND